MPKRIAIVWCSLVLFLLSCLSAGATSLGDAPAGSPSSGTTVEPSSTATGTPTVTATATPTSIDTPTATSTIPPTPLPMPRLRATYVSMEGIWFVEPPAPPVLLCPEELPDRMMISDDGTIIVYSYEDPSGFAFAAGEIFVESGIKRELFSEKRIISSNKEATGIRMVWIPGSHRMLLTTSYWDASAGMVSENDLFVLNLDTQGVLRIFPSGKGGLPTPSPDGRRMTIARFRSLTLASIEGNVLFPDLFPSDAGNAMDNSFPKVIWVSDSTRFGIMPGRLLPYYTDSTAAFWAVDAATGDISALGSIDHFTEGGLSPTLEYVGHTRPGKNSHFPEDVTLSRVDGSSSVLLFRGISQFLSFSPDGLHFFYRVGCQPGTYSYCPSDAPPLQFFLGSLDGNSFPVIRPGKWINNSQFVYKHDGGSLRLGDIGGNWTEIAKADYIHSFDAVDLDFQTGGES